MFQPRELATIRAALLYWEEEMAPHGSSARQPYYDVQVGEALSPKELVALRAQFTDQLVRYAIYDPDNDQLADTALFASAKEAAAQAEPANSIATMFLPA